MTVSWAILYATRQDIQLLQQLPLSPFHNITVVVQLLLPPFTLTPTPTVTPTFPLQHYIYKPATLHIHHQIQVPPSTEHKTHWPGQPASTSPVLTAPHKATSPLFNTHSLNNKSLLLYDIIMYNKPGLSLSHRNLANTPGLLLTKPSHPHMIHLYGQTPHRHWT